MFMSWQGSTIKEVNDCELSIKFTLNRHLTETNLRTIFTHVCHICTFDDDDDI